MDPKGPGSRMFSVLFDFLGVQVVGVATLLLKEVAHTEVQVWSALVGSRAWPCHTCPSGETGKGMAL